MKSDKKIEELIRQMYDGRVEPREPQESTSERLLRAIHGDKVRHHFTCEKHGSYSIFVPQGVDPMSVPHQCPICEQEEEKRKKMQQSQKAAMFRARDVVAAFLREEGVSVPTGYTFEQYIQKTEQQGFAKSVCERFASGFLDRYFDGKPGIGICMLGSCGTGKTHLATSILAVFKEKDVPGIIVRVADLVDALNSDPSQVSKRIGALGKVSCLVLDDLGASSLTDSEQKRMYQIFDARIQARLPTIFTSNLDEEDFRRAVNDRIMSRIDGNTYRMKIVGPDHRKDAPSVDDLLGRKHA